MGASLKWVPQRSKLKSGICITKKSCQVLHYIHPFLQRWRGVILSLYFKVTGFHGEVEGQERMFYSGMRISESSPSPMQVMGNMSHE